MDEERSTGYSDAVQNEGEPIVKTDAVADNKRKRPPQRVNPDKREIPCEILAAIMKGRRTRKQLAEMCQVNKATVSSWILYFHQSGLVYKAARDIAKPQTGAGAILWAMQPTPFHHEDQV